MIGVVPGLGNAVGQEARRRSPEARWRFLAESLVRTLLDVVRADGAEAVLLLAVDEDVEGGLRRRELDGVEGALGDALRGRELEARDRPAGRLRRVWTFDTDAPYTRTARR